MNLFKITDTLWAVNHSGKVYHGTRKEALRYLVQLGVLKAEASFAAIELLRTGHNSANFGMNKTFMFTKFVEEVAFMIPTRGVA